MNVTSENPTAQPRRGTSVLRRIGGVLAAMAIALSTVLVTAPAANAADALCLNLNMIQCGQITLASGSTSSKVATNYRSSSSVAGIVKSISAGHNTAEYAYRSGVLFRDWDAVWVKSGACLIGKNPFGVSFTGMNRIGKSGAWMKITGWGATVKITSGKCPKW